MIQKLYIAAIDCLGITLTSASIFVLIRYVTHLIT